MWYIIMFSGLAILLVVVVLIRNARVKASEGGSAAPTKHRGRVPYRVGQCRAAGSGRGGERSRGPTAANDTDRGRRRGVQTHAETPPCTPVLNDEVLCLGVAVVALLGPGIVVRDRGQRLAISSLSPGSIVIRPSSAAPCSAAPARQSAWSSAWTETRSLSSLAWIAWPHSCAMIR